MTSGTVQVSYLFSAGTAIFLTQYASSYITESRVIFSEAESRIIIDEVGSARQVSILRSVRALQH